MQHTDKMREEFEAWFVGKWPANRLYRRDELPESDPHYDEYVNPHVLHAYEGWKASRASMVVELPQPMQAPPYAAYEGGWNDMRGEAKDAIEAAGVKVKE